MIMRTKLSLLLVAVSVALVLAGCGSGVWGDPEPRASLDANAETGRALIAGYGCGSCHSIPGVPAADSMAAPPLVSFYKRSFIAGRLANTEDNLAKWIADPQEVEPGTAMPDLGVTLDDAHNIAQYLYHEPSVLDWLRR